MPVASSASKRTTRLRPPPGKKQRQVRDTKPRPKTPTPSAPSAAADVVSHPMIVPHKDLKPSPTNPRKTFSESALNSLADSIRKVGIRQRILVRSESGFGLKGPYEIVAGERRWRAAKLAGLAMVPVDLAELTDEQVLAIQLVENDEREDLPASEQAAAYARLAGKGATAEKIHEITGRPLSVVRGLLRLGRLPREILLAVDEGKLQRTTAELICKIPSEEERARCAAFVLAGQRWAKPGDKSPKPRADAEVLTFRETKELISNCFQIELKGAPFDRLALDLVKSAGTCEACPKRAGNAAKEDPEYAGTRGDTCLDPACYKLKVEADNRRLIEDAKANGQRILPRSEIIEIFNSWSDDLSYNAPYVDLGAKCYDDTRGRNYRALLNGKVARDQIVIAQDLKGNVHELVSKSVAASILKKEHSIGNGVGRSVSVSSTSREDKERERKAKLRKKAAVMANTAVVAKTWDAMQDLKFSEPATKMLRAAIIGLLDQTWSGVAERIAKRRGHPDVAALDRAASEMDGPNLLALLAEVVSSRISLEYGSHWFTGTIDPADKEFWQTFGIDFNALVEQVKNEESASARTPELNGHAKATK